MVGNSSVPAVTLCMLALHATILTPYNVATEAAAVAFEEENLNKSRLKTERHLRQQTQKNFREHRPEKITQPHQLDLPAEIDRMRREESLDSLTYSQPTHLLHNEQRKLSPCQWFPDNINKDGCTNNPEKIDPIWLSTPAIRDQLFHQTSEACCNAFFQGRECSIYSDNRCGDQNEAFPGSGAPSCVSPGWYPDNTKKDGCSNGKTYQEDWLRPTMINKIFSPSSEACCNTFFKGLNCKVYDEGCTVDPSKFGLQPAGQVGGSGQVVSNNNCESEWHPDVKLRSGCTNDRSDYPSTWNTPENRASYFRPTAYECCNRFNQGGACNVRDACKGDTITKIQITNSPTAKPTHGPRECMWHPSLNSGGQHACDYSDTYPVEWIDSSRQYLYDDHTECCQREYNQQHCGKTALCDTPSPTLSPTTAKPTPPPTTTQPTTPQPTNQPTSFIWLMRSGVCVRNSEVRKPTYITTRYSSFEDCCSDSHKEVRCRRDAPPPPTQSPTKPQPTISPTTGQPTITAMPVSPAPTIGHEFFIDYLSGSCIDAKKTKVPHWITANDIYTDYWICCDNSFSRSQCIKEGPSKGWSKAPTGRPTALESEPPSSQPSDLHSSVPSGQPSEPTSSPTTLYWGALRTFSAKPTHRPTIFDCSDSSWHVDANVDQGCTNLDLSPTQNAVLLFNTMEECCSILFGGLDCAVNDQCRRSNSILPADQNIPYDCDNDWHPIMSYPRDGCSNSVDIPSSWKKPENRDGVLFGTANECCQQYYIDQGIHCRIDSRCTTEPPTNRPTEYPTPIPTHPVTYPKHVYPKPAPASLASGVTSPCDSAKWHISLGSKEMACSNSLTYPATWNDPAMTGNFLFDTHYDCCERFSFGNPDACGKHDVCIYEVTMASSTETIPGAGAAAKSESNPGSSCVSAKWHMTQDFTKCSNNFEYPQTWLEFGEKYFSDNPADCCMKTFNYKFCEIEDICATSNVSQTTAATTMIWSTKTDASGAGKECESGRWHITQDFSKCSNDFEYPDSWLEDEERYFFDEPTDCCIQVFNYPICDIEDICESHGVNQSEEKTTTMGTMTELTTANSRIPNPTHLPTSSPTNDPFQTFNALKDDLNECSGKTRRQCFYDPRCQYDTTGRICAPLAVSEPSTEHQFPSDPTYGTTPTTEVTQPSTALNDSPNECIGKPMRRCRDDPGCQYDETSSTCETLLMLSQSTTQHNFEGEPSQKTANDNTKTTSISDSVPLQTSNSAHTDKCIGKPMRRCRDDPGCQYDTNSHTCSTVLETPEPITQHDIGGKPADVAAKSPNNCAGKPKKDCVREPDCIWNKDERSCIRAGELADGIDTAAQIIPTTTSCDGRTWHPKSISDRLCSNSFDYPSVWNDPSFPVQNLFNTFEDCCEAIYDGKCNKDDECGAIDS